MIDPFDDVSTILTGVPLDATPAVPTELVTDLSVPVSDWRDMVCEVNLSNITGDTDAEVGLVFRAKDTSNFMAAYIDDGDDLVHLASFVAGSEATIATAAWTRSDTAELRVIVQRYRIRVWVDFELVIDATSTLNLTGGSAGLFSRSTAVVTFDDFYAEGL